MTEQKIPQIGDAVKVVTSDYKETNGLVTAVHGVGYKNDAGFHQPSINVVYVSTDAAKSDSYGRQIERDLCSLQHYGETEGMPKRGRYWDFK